MTKDELERKYRSLIYELKNLTKYTAESLEGHSYAHLHKPSNVEQINEERLVFKVVDVNEILRNH